MEIKLNHISGKKPYLLAKSSDPNTIKLDIVENLFGECPMVRDALSTDVDGLFKYPSSNDADKLKSQIIKYLELENDSDKNIILTNGSDNALKLILDTFAINNCKIGILIPTYPHFLQMADTTYAEVEHIKCHDSESFVEMINNGTFDKFQMLYLCSPNLPFGYMIDLDNIQCVAEKYPNLIIIIDEAYIEYGEQFDKKSCVGLGNKNVIVTRTFSKFFGLAALRLGYIVCHKQMYDKLCVMHNGKNITHKAMLGGSIALSNIDFYNKKLEEFYEIKNYLKSQLLHVKDNDEPPTKMVYKYNLQYGNFFLIYARDTKYVCDMILKLSNIAVRDKSDEIPNAIRISIAPLKYMKTIMFIIKLLNKLESYKNIYVDLDGTIRPDSKLSSTVSPKWVDFLVKYPCTIITNNTYHEKSEIRKQIFHDMDIKKEIPILQPYVRDCLVLGRSLHDSPNQPKGVLFNNSMFDLGSEKIAYALKLLHENQEMPVYIISENESFSADHISETTIYGKFDIPDYGILLKYINNTIIKIGKPCIDYFDGHLCQNGEQILMIGDSLTDIEFAKKLNPLNDIIIIDSSIKDPYIKNEILYVKSITDLQDIIF